MYGILNLTFSKHTNWPTKKNFKNVFWRALQTFPESPEKETVIGGDSERKLK